jgi:hypothetical protein
VVLSAGTLVSWLVTGVTERKEGMSSGWRRLEATP